MVRNEYAAVQVTMGELEMTGHSRDASARRKAWVYDTPCRETVEEYAKTAFKVLGSKLRFKGWPAIDYEGDAAPLVWEVLAMQNEALIVEIVSELGIGMRNRSELTSLAEDLACGVTVERQFTVQLLCDLAELSAGGISAAKETVILSEIAARSFTSRTIHIKAKFGFTKWIRKVVGTETDATSITTPITIMKMIADTYTLHVFRKSGEVMNQRTAQPIAVTATLCLVEALVVVICLGWCTKTLLKRKMWIAIRAVSVVVAYDTIATVFSRIDSQATVGTGFKIYWTLTAVLNSAMAASANAMMEQSVTVEEGVWPHRAIPMLNGQKDKEKTELLSVVGVNDNLVAAVIDENQQDMAAYLIAGAFKKGYRPKIVLTSINGRVEGVRQKLSRNYTLQMEVWEESMNPINATVVILAKILAAWLGGRQPYGIATKAVTVAALVLLNGSMVESYDSLWAENRASKNKLPMLFIISASAIAATAEYVYSYDGRYTELTLLSIENILHWQTWGTSLLTLRVMLGRRGVESSDPLENVIACMKQTKPKAAKCTQRNNLQLLAADMGRVDGATPGFYTGLAHSEREAVNSEVEWVACGSKLEGGSILIGGGPSMHFIIGRSPSKLRSMASYLRCVAKKEKMSVRDIHGTRCTGVEIWVRKRSV